jgi:hypothetical protein
MLGALSRSRGASPSASLVFPLLEKQEHQGKNNDYQNHNHSQNDARM